jgi:hypothetical protein
MDQQEKSSTIGVYGQGGASRREFGRIARRSEGGNRKQDIGV